MKKVMCGNTKEIISLLQMALYLEKTQIGFFPLFKWKILSNLDFVNLKLNSKHFLKLYVKKTNA